MKIPFHDLTGEEVSVKESLMGAKVNERCCVIGTLFKKMELKPSILKEISNSVRAQSIYLHTPSLPLSLHSSIHPYPFSLIKSSLIHTRALLLSLPLQQHLLPQPPRAKSISTSDALVVEDSSQRIALCGDIPSAELVTGTIDVAIQAGYGTGSRSIPLTSPLV